ncbi:DEAD/DEAH box helicase family protein [Streptomyces albus]|nr:DEAD/DEAH box helicase family protein [Streptomyces albus]QID39805.1 DEAD/DEAH box helicase family protein [Streptomyces albus]
MTNDPLRVAMALTAGGPLAVFATYDSLPVVVRAHELFALPSWDLIIADEAHRTCMGVGEGWGKVHDDQLVPAKVRLYMTATPRIFNGQAPRELAEFVERAPTATMDREDVFGPTVYTLGLAKAIEEGILADYQVLMPVVGDDDLQTILAERRPATSAHHDGLRTAAIQVAVLRAMAEQDLRRVLVFHNRVDAAHHFAGTLPATAAAVPAPLRIEKLWAYAIDGEQDPATAGCWRLRRRGDPEGRAVQRAGAQRRRRHARGRRGGVRRPPLQRDRRDPGDRPGPAPATRQRQDRHLGHPGLSARQNVAGQAAEELLLRRPVVDPAGPARP